MVQEPVVDLMQNVPEEPAAPEIVDPAAEVMKAIMTKTSLTKFKYL